MPPHPERTRAEAGGQPADQRRLARFAELVSGKLGIRLPPSKMTMLHSRLQRRMRRLDLDTLEQYEALVFDSDRSAGELPHLLDVVTTNKTDFFREPQHFELLTTRALPAIGRQRGSSWTCRVWCAGCSYGPEVYTLAMVLSEYAASHPGFSFSIWATDVSSQVLQQATAAVYPEELVAPVPPGLRSKYLLRSKDPVRRRVKIVPELRRHVSFSQLNFMDARYPAPGPFDVIFFRNVMIYFDKPTQEQVINRQCRHLRDGGFFFISHTESILGLRVPLRGVGPSVFRKVP